MDHAGIVSVGIPGNPGRLGIVGGIGSPGIGGTGGDQAGMVNVGMPGSPGRLGMVGGMGNPGIGGIGGIQAGITRGGKAQLVMAHHGLTKSVEQGGEATPASNGTAVDGLPITTLPDRLICPVIVIPPSSSMM